MGNEGSVPEGADDEFEHQARAPPSYSNPQQTTNQQSSTSNSSRTTTAGGRMINTVLHRRDKNKQNHHHSTETMTPYPAAAYSMNGNGVISSSNGVDEMNIGQERQQQDYMQQETYQIQQRTEMPSNQYYAQQSQEQNQYASTSTSRNNHPDNPSVEQREVGVMYQSPSRPKKGGMNFRPSGRGAAIINSMKNLSIGSAIQRATGKDKSGNGGGGGGGGEGAEVNDWETKWDEDDDDESDDEEIVNPPTIPIHPLVRPNMDARQTNIPQTNEANSVETTQQKAHLVTATPESDIHPPHRVPVEHGVDWDTGIVPGEATQDKPNVQMFLPLLRVLGKGSFGKVGFRSPLVFPFL